jgi:hypothetical protein
MREETVQIETRLSAMNRRLEEAGGMPLDAALRAMHAIKSFLASCAACGCAEELTFVMERAGLGDLAEALLPLIRR